MTLSNSAYAALSVLVVDDEKFSRRLLVGMTRDLGFGTVAEASSGREALEVLARPEHPIDCVVSDISMPGVNGLQLLQAIRVGTARVRRDLPVIMLSGHADQSMAAVALSLDVDDLLVKPATRQTVGQSVARVVADRRERRAPEDYARVVTRLDKASPGGAAAWEAGLTSFTELHVGMVLAADLVARTGCILLAAGNVVDHLVLDLIGRLRAVDGMLDHGGAAA